MALAISNALQRRITRPILALAEAAKAVSEGDDYSIRVAKVSQDETGLLTEAFNRMLARIEEQTETLRQSEERFRALVTASSDVVYRMSPDWSEMRYLRGRDFVPDTAAPSRAWLQKYIHPEDQPQVMAVIGRAIATRSIFELEHRVLRVDGGSGWTFSRAVPLLDTKGEIVEWFGAAQDMHLAMLR